MNLRPLLLSALVLASGLLAACSTAPTYDCPLVGAGAGKCASTERAYAQAQSIPPGTVGNAQSVFQVATPAVGAQPVAPPVIGALARTPGPGQTGMPVFQQPKVMRVWIAPYVDADGNLHSGEYTYFSTPGRWNYGTMKQPGDASSGMFEPAKPGDYGFNPVDNLATAGAPPPPPVVVPANAPQEPPKIAAPGVTQPYQKLTP